MHRSASLILFLILGFGQIHAQIISDKAVGYHINAAHTGAIQTAGLSTPLIKRWIYQFTGKVSYPLIANGRIFVTVGNSSGEKYGTKLYAFDSKSGQIIWGPIHLGGTYYWSGICYEDGKVFALNYNGVLRAFNETDGSEIWATQLTGQYSFTSAPTVYKGTIYTAGAGSGGTLYAVRAATGEIAWTRPVTNGDQSSPAVNSEGVYVSYSCPNVYKFDPVFSTPLWSYSNGCSGGGGKTPALYKDRLYVRDFSNHIFDTLTGEISGSFESKTVPAFIEDRAFYLKNSGFNAGGQLEAFDLTTGQILWSFSGDGALKSAPIVVNKNVFVGSGQGNLYALDYLSGKTIWSTNVGAAILSPDEQNVSQPLTGLAAGEGILAVPAGLILAVYAQDNTYPTLTWGVPTPAANEFGWNNTAVTLGFNVSDDSGIASTSLPSPLVFSSAGANQSATVTVTDNAGNSSVFTSPFINIDLTAPQSSASLAGTSVNNWYTGSVVATLAGSDALSGVAATYYSVDTFTGTYSNPINIIGDGTHVLSFWSVDKAGNSEAKQSRELKIDSTAPAITASATPSTIKQNKRPVRVSVKGTIKDALSQYMTGSAMFRVIDEYGVTQPSGSIFVNSDGSYSFAVDLTATRNRSDSNGRLYTIEITATDQAGNSGKAVTTVVVL